MLGIGKREDLDDLLREQKLLDPFLRTYRYENTNHYIINWNAFIAGCATTPQSRVDENPGLFDSFTAEQKEIILKGEVDLGFTPEMVMMAAGVPDRKAKKRSKNGTSEVWTYYQYSPRSIHGFGNYGSYYSFSSRYHSWYRNGNWGDHVVVSREGEREKNLVVEFQKGEIISFEMVQ